MRNGEEEMVAWLDESVEDEELDELKQQEFLAFSQHSFGQCHIAVRVEIQDRLEFHSIEILEIENGSRLVDQLWEHSAQMKC